jgi:hypothetical protein
MFSSGRCRRSAPGGSGTSATRLPFAESLSTHDLYVGVGLSTKDYGATHRCLSDEIGGLVGIWADIDLKSEAHTKALAASIEEALDILPPEFPPSFLISTGNGLHAWWLFREPLIFENGEERQEAAALVNRWQTLLRLNSAAHGWAFDRLADLARVLRVPGTCNCKDPQNRKPVSVRTHSDHRYNPSDFTEFLDDNGVPDEVEQERTAKAWTSEVAAHGLSANPNAAIPDELLNRYMEANPRFKSTWLRHITGSVLPYLRWPVFRCPSLAGFQVSPEDKKNLALKGHMVTIHTEVDDVRGSGHYSTLPAPDASAASTRRAVVRVVNKSRYTVRFLETGPTSELHPIPPGGSREMLVSAGDYEVVAKVVAKLEGSDALAFYRKQTYASATQYVYCRSNVRSSCMGKVESSC